jgi:hypothetical protein
MKNHPAADVFPMLTTDELSDLADDIETNGQQYPIVVFEKQIIDGRNRFAACKLRKLTPEFTDFNGTEDDVVPFVISSNLARRHMNKGQCAMAAAMMYQLHNVIEGKDLAKIVGVSEKTISYARQVLNADIEGAEVQAQRVLDGKLSLAQAHQWVKENADSKQRLIDQRKATEKLVKHHTELVETLQETLDDLPPLPPPPDFTDNDVILERTGGLDDEALDSLTKIVEWAGALEQVMKTVPDISDIPTEPAMQEFTAQAIESYIQIIQSEGRSVSIALCQAVDSHKTLRSVSA